MLEDCIATLRQLQHVNNLEKVSEANVDHASYVSQRAWDAYIASISRPDPTFGFAVCSRVVNADAINCKRLDKYVNMPKKSKNLGLSFVPLDADSIRIAVFADARSA